MDGECGWREPLRCSQVVTWNGDHAGPDRIRSACCSDLCTSVSSCCMQTSCCANILAQLDIGICVKDHQALHRGTENMILNLHLISRCHGCDRGGTCRGTCLSPRKQRQKIACGKSLFCYVNTSLHQCSTSKMLETRSQRLS